VALDDRYKRVAKLSRSNKRKSALLLNENGKSGLSNKIRGGTSISIPTKLEWKLSAGYPKATPENKELCLPFGITTKVPYEE